MDVLGTSARWSLVLPSRLSKCLRFLLRMGTCSAPRSRRRNWLNSWWKCQPFFFPSSRSLTIRFRVVVFLDMEVFKIFPQNRVLLLLVEQIIVFTLQFVVCLAMEGLKVYAQDRFQQRFLKQNTDLFKVYAQDKIRQRFAEQNMNLFTNYAQDRIQQRFGEQNMELVKVYSKKRVPRRFSEVQVLVEGLKTLSQYRVQVFVMMCGSWSRRRSSTRLAGDCQLACVMGGCVCSQGITSTSSLRPRRGCCPTSKGDHKSPGVTVVVSAVKDQGQFGSCRAFAALVGADFGWMPPRFLACLMEFSPSMGTYGCYGWYGRWPGDCNVWFDSGYLYCVCFPWFFEKIQVYVLVNSYPEVDFRRALHGFRAVLVSDSGYMYFDSFRGLLE